MKAVGGGFVNVDYEWRDPPENAADICEKILSLNGYCYDIFRKDGTRNGIPAYWLRVFSFSAPTSNSFGAIGSVYFEDVHLSEHIESYGGTSKITSLMGHRGYPTGVMASKYVETSESAQYRDASPIDASPIVDYVFSSEDECVSALYNQLLGGGDITGMKALGIRPFVSEDELKLRLAVIGI